MKKIKSAPRKPITRLKTPYEGGDALMEWHKEKMKSVPYDADYATAIWRCETRFEHELRIVKACAGIALGVGLAYWFAVGLVDWLKNWG